MILIIDNKSRFIKIFEKRLKRAKIKYKIVKSGQRIDLLKLKGLKGIIPGYTIPIFLGAAGVAAIGLIYSIMRKRK